jgi:hypothetical protein
MTTLSPLGDALLEVHLIAVAVGQRTAKFDDGKRRTLAHLEGLVEDGERIAEAARRAIAALRDQITPPAEQLALFGAEPPPPHPDALGPGLTPRPRTPVERERLKRCRDASCRAPMVYLDRAGAPHPVDAGTVRAGETTFDKAVGHVSHFDTCPAADKFRGR